MTTTSCPSPLLSFPPLQEVLTRDPQRKIKFYSVKERKAEIFLPPSPSDFTLNEEHSDLSGMSIHPSSLPSSLRILYYTSRSSFSLLYSLEDDPYVFPPFKLPSLPSSLSPFLILFKGEDGVISIVHDEYSTLYCYDFFERRAFFAKTNADSM